MRILLVSTPRSGNTWFRRLLAQCLNLSEYAEHTPCAVDWEKLPERSVVQLHWHRTPVLQELLQKHGIQPVVIVRHPLAVLISILHFCNFEPDTSRWLDGAEGDESRLLNTPPTSASFLEYAHSARFEALLQVSGEWFDPNIPHVRYEELVHDPERTLAGFVSTVDEQSVQNVRSAIGECDISKLRATSTNWHFWQGRPDTWMELISIETASAIYKRHRALFDKLGYSIDGARQLNPDAVNARWNAIAAVR